MTEAVWFRMWQRMRRGEEVSYHYRYYGSIEGNSHYGYGEYSYHDPFSGYVAESYYGNGGSSDEDESIDSIDYFKLKFGQLKRFTLAFQKGDYDIRGNKVTLH